MELMEGEGRRKLPQDKPREKEAGSSAARELCRGAASNGYAAVWNVKTLASQLISVRPATSTDGRRGQALKVQLMGSPSLPHVPVATKYLGSLPALCSRARLGLHVRPNDSTRLVLLYKPYVMLWQYCRKAIARLYGRASEKPVEMAGAREETKRERERESEERQS
ncbi:hypothetical protein K431DRAFT_122899 [Polychaeton citri CBS 116435]|uniref:Uncharacterized protein n=1 Tax=Polychaeton citri CBS 116435 TaxID=1314669 RepID=A0A9P4Q3R5_9PEZI|nr:hypothetical protein K431DRAFT_122899 [Polychaeton citri CBS 116435]